MDTEVLFPVCYTGKHHLGNLSVKLKTDFGSCILYLEVDILVLKVCPAASVCAFTDGLFCLSTVESETDITDISGKILRRLLSTLST